MTNAVYLLNKFSFKIYSLCIIVSNHLLVTRYENLSHYVIIFTEQIQLTLVQLIQS